MKYTAIEKSEFINTEMKSYIKSTFQVEDEEFRDLFNKQIDDVELVKGPYISVSHPFKTGKSINELIIDGELETDFSKLTSLNLTRPLYKHQEEAILGASKGLNLVVSTGTGSGKTESFMIPVINEIMSDIKKGIQNRGIQAMFLYPMNALANDQRERLREILEEYPEITFGFYTGETKVEQREAEIQYKSEHDRTPLVNEIISREVIREEPPNILFTNYSMLEYLLLRPDDVNLFSVENTSLWKYIVLDEAHIYRGALGIEISMLIKRLLSNINSHPKFILTSATLATNKDDYPEVIDFAQRLTSQQFINEGIILADRVIREKPIELISIDHNEFRLLKDNKMHALNFYNQKISQGESDHKKSLNELILRSKQFFEFTEAIETPKTIEDITKKLDYTWSKDDIIDFIDLIAFVNSDDNLFLIDVKYHTFIKTLDGAQVTVKPQKVMYLKKTHTHKYLNDYNEYEYIKTFDLSVCKYCKSPYLVGRIHDNTFYKLEDEELYEQYDEIYEKGSDIFLLENNSSDETNSLTPYELCNQCGHITDLDNLNSSICSCHKKYKFLVYKKQEDNQKYRTNITECYSCGAKNNMGIIESFYIGKDSASSMIAQLLYKKMGSKNELEKSIEVSDSLFDFSKPITIKKEIKKDTKQIIAFSDSRQQASYFATYFEDRHLSFLRKRLITKELEDVNSITIENLLDNLEYEIDKSKLFPSNMNSRRQAWISILYDLLNIDRKYSLSGLGLVCFHPKFDFSRLNNEIISQEFGGMTLKDFKTLIYFILDSLRHIPAIDYFDDSKLTKEERREYLLYRSTDKGGLTLYSEKNAKYIKSLIPKNKRGNQYSNYMMKAFGIDYDTAITYLQKLSNFLFDEQTNPMIRSNGHNSFFYNYKGWEIKNGNSVDWYNCNKCGTLTHLNINNKCVKSDCDGVIGYCDPNEINKNNYYYREYLSKEIEKIRIEEHTAQLTHSKAREYQRDFKYGDINILSSSTTFEMGVDIGDLDTVYMRNVPPTPANYIQRAGRAGRRKDTAAYIITFCSSNSHDYTYFESPEKMINGKIKPPYFKVENKKIIYRHILSIIISDYFKVNTEQFSSASIFFDNEGITQLKEYIENNKQEFIRKISTDIYYKFSEEFNEWQKTMICNSDSPIMIMKNAYENEKNELEIILKDLDMTERSINQTEKRLKQLRNEKMINLLSKNNVIPKYGFPIDTVHLEIPSKKSYDISRDLSTAISEYAPGSEVIVDKSKYRSRYIATAMNREPIEYYYNICEDCGRLVFNISKQNDIFHKPCENCGNEKHKSPKRFIKPIHGFIAENDEVNERSLKPKRTYSSDYYYVGNSKLIDHKMNIGNIVVKSAVDNHLALLNESSFFTCSSCGFTEINKADSMFLSIEREHSKPRIDIPCNNMTLYKTALGHDFMTDVVIIEFNEEINNKYTLLSVLFALLEGMSNALDIERMDISGIIQNLDGKQQIILFDSVPGGAGHVKRLLVKRDFISVINAAYRKVSQECCDESSSCYNCLRNFGNQRVHNILKRGNAKEFLKSIL